MSPLYAIVLLCLFAQSSLSAMAAPLGTRGSVTLFPNLKQLSNDNGSTRVLSAQTNSTSSSSPSSSSASSSVCAKWSTQCTSTCASIDATAQAVSSCNIRGQVLRRSQLGALSCKCGTQTITSQVLPKVYKSMNIDSSAQVLAPAQLSSSSANATSTTTVATAPAVLASVPTASTAGSLPVVTRVTANQGALWHGQNFIPLDESFGPAIESSSTVSPVIIGTWTPAAPQSSSAL